MYENNYVSTILSNTNFLVNNIYWCIKKDLFCWELHELNFLNTGCFYKCGKMSVMSMVLWVLPTLHLIAIRYQSIDFIFQSLNYYIEFKYCCLSLVHTYLVFSYVYSVKW